MRSQHNAIIKSTLVMGVATFLSRLLGFLRDVVLARLFGVYSFAQAFVVAFRIPNLFRDLVGEGAANSAIVPVFSQYKLDHTKEEFWELANIVLNLLLVILAAIAIAGIVLSPVIVRLIAPGFAASPEKLALTIKLNQIIFPYIILVSLAAYSMAILNCLGHFSVPAFAPCLLNISIIVFALVFGEGSLGLAGGVLAGGFLQLAIQIPVLLRKGFRLRLFKNFKHPAAIAIGKLMMPRILSSSIYQLSNFVDSIFGSLAFLAGEGAVAALYFAYRLIQFPIGVFSNSLSQAVLPNLSVQACSEDKTCLKQTLLFSLRAVFMVMLPVSVFFIIFSDTIITSIFLGGKFDSYSASITSRVFACYSLGITFYAVVKILQSCFFALKNTVIPMKVSALSLGLSVIFNLILTPHLKASGIALSSSIAGFICAIVLSFALEKHIGIHALKETLSSLWRVSIASVCMGTVCFWLKKFSPETAFFWQKASYLLLVTLLSFCSYVLFCFILGLREMKQFFCLLTLKK
ncbi:MAG: murein biosynthesis integral membrane protein MurJ [Candidatus Omnitrophica bacterium]|jgi:putative peptidoglycan lipid II flippase|nr:murein biosynthesis integral membrane protein MurJ [Candidatus Omnitrophota bacterium]